MKTLCCCIIGYLIGCINPSYFLGKMLGLDIREKGSGNAGASNALILFGKLRGTLCAIFDILKAYIAITIAETLFPSYSLTFALTATSCILGHIFPFYINFHGGKGLASLGGAILKYDWRIFLIMLLCASVMAIIVNYICFVPICASITFSVIYALRERNLLAFAILFVTAVIIFIKHIENLNRIKNGTELHLSFLWNKNDEFARIKQSGNADDRQMEERFLQCK